jgi:WD40-like Beta Propeller Repeat
MAVLNCLGVLGAAAVLLLVMHRESIVRAEAASGLLPVSIDYPENGSIFPPGITPPTLLWRDAAGTSWAIDFSFEDGGSPIHEVTKGERMRVGEIDPETVSETNEPPQLTPQQAATWTWTPDPGTWAAIQVHSIAGAATLTVTGFRDGKPWSQSRVRFSTSKDEVGAPVFYRDVPLMPSINTSGHVSPLSNASVPLIAWRLRDIRRTESRTLLKDMPTCANCHSFSADGKTFGMDIDGPANDKGLYAVVPVQKHMTIDAKDLLHWNTGGTVGASRVGFMSQVSPDGRYVLTTFAGPAVKSLVESYYVSNFMDYRFLQVFYPTRGILEYYDRKDGMRHSLAGADDPKYVQTDGVWSHDGKWIVFAKAVARDPHFRGQRVALHTLDENETPIQYDLYRVPFNGGKGGLAERIAGASENGMSNNFPKISPDGKWIVFVQCKSGQLMRPDSQLYIVPFAGGAARRMRANTRLMNSWHSFSPNGRWLVFSSKARSPYTQMYLTHIDEKGNDSPAILIDNATAANRAVNIPEFVNMDAASIEEIKVNVADEATRRANAADKGVTVRTADKPGVN